MIYLLKLVIVHSLFCVYQRVSTKIYGIHQIHKTIQYTSGIHKYNYLYIYIHGLTIYIYIQQLCSNHSYIDGYITIPLYIYIGELLL